MEFIILDAEEEEMYRCNNCGREFKGKGKKPLCPECQSEKIAPL
jgi:predicted Zn-ribbon and HTH transcriptional regulator